MKNDNVNDQLPFVSIVIPCRNEELFIDKCLDSAVANDYPKDRLEVIVVDGMSDDATRDILKEYVDKHPYIKSFDNVKREQPIALNIGITQSHGDIIMRWDAHSTYKNDYIKECVKALKEYPADNVGGRWIIVPRGDTLLEKAVVHAVSVPFGVGNAYYRLKNLDSDEPYLKKTRWEINVAYFCCRKEVFDKIGLFNENLFRSEDIDFRSRLRKAGYRTLFVPTVECYYSMRTKYSEFVRHMFANGKWVFLPFNYAPNISFSFRHFVPLLFVLCLAALALLSFFSPVMLLFFVAAILVHTSLNFYFSYKISMREKDWRYLFVLPFIFVSLHVAYGIGSVFGAISVMKMKFFPSTSS